METKQIPLPPSALSFSTLSRVDYTDAFLLACPDPKERSGEAWARALLEEAPPATRAMLRRGWSALGIRLGSAGDPRFVLGWEIREASADFAVLAARSLFGINAELLIRREPGGLLVADFMHFGNLLVRLFWAGFSFQHRRVVRHVVSRLGNRLEADARDATAVEGR